jgi:hypothetical protein
VPPTVVERYEKGLADFVLGLFKLFHENNAALAVVARQMVVHHRVLLPPLIRRPRTKEVCLVGEVGTVHALESQGEQAIKVLGQFRLAMTTWTCKEQDKRSTSRQGEMTGNSAKHRSAFSKHGAGAVIEHTYIRKRSIKSSHAGPWPTRK